MKTRFTLPILISLLVAPSTSWAYCKNEGYYNECSDLSAVSRIIESGSSENYMNYLARPSLFISEKYRPSTKKEISDDKRFLEVAMPIAKDRPELAFYVGSVIRKGRWAREGYGFGYGTKQHKIYDEQIEYFEKSL